jgi:prepilin peptidase CpaA
MMALALNITIAAVAAWAAVTDVRARRIPNWCCAVIAALALAGALLQGGPAVAASALGAALAAFAIGIVVYALGMVGAGDVKLLAPLVLWVGVAGVPAFLTLLAVAAIALSAWSIATRGRRLAAPTGSLADAPKRTTLPLGLALSGAAIATVFLP